MDACPSSVCTALRSAHFLSKLVAKEWRNVCGLTFFLMPAAIAYFFTNSSIAFLLSLLPRLLPERLTNKYSPSSVLNLRYWISLSLACLVINTDLSLDHLPTTENCLESLLICTLVRCVSSDTLSPVPYRNRRIASSLAMARGFVSIWCGMSSIFSTSSSSKWATSLGGILANSSFSGLMTLYSFFMRNFKKALMATIW